jgi:hypothetical protein
MSLLRGSQKSFDGKTLLGAERLDRVDGVLLHRRVDGGDPLLESPRQAVQRTRLSTGRAASGPLYSAPLRGKASVL